MKRISFSFVALAALTVVFIGGGIAGGYWLAEKTHKKNHAKENTATNKNILYWYDPMVPNQHFDKAGKSPFMDMPLVPKYTGEKAGERIGVRVSPTLQQNLGVRLAPVEQRVLGNTVDAVGTIGFNERELAIVQARANGFVSRVYSRAPGDMIARGAPLVDIVVPEWTSAQQEYLALRRSSDSALADAARERLHSLGMSDDLIRIIERSGQPQTSATITSPISGVITALDVRTGMTVPMGMTLAQINALDTVWLSAAIPELLGASIAVGDHIEAQLAALGNTKCEGRVIAILPQTDATNRTLTVRIELPNTRGELRPGQYARVQIRSNETGSVVVVPSAALIRSGTRTVALVAHGNQFQPIEVEIGRETGDITEIRSGLRPGQQVVVSGQFLIDSEANLSGVLQQMSGGAQ